MDDRPTEDPPTAVQPDPPGPSTWWQLHHRQFWLVLALFVAATAPIWGGLLLLWLFAPGSPLP
jgi:hypothetical protein